MNDDFIREIKENTEFQLSDEITIEYDQKAPEYTVLENRYHISEIAGKSDLEKSLNLLGWVNQHIRHKGNYDNSDRQDALTLLEVAFDKDYGINCLAMSIVLCECLLAVKMKARVMYMMPQNVEDSDNHVVVETFVSDLNKWIMLDPTYGCYITSVTMTVFYVILYYVWRLRYSVEGKNMITYAVYFLGILRIVLCLFPQNAWTSSDAPLSWGIYRNIPFTILGILIITLFYKSARENHDVMFRHMWLTILISFGFYLPVVLFADAVPMIGMLMMPKTCAYVWTVLIGFHAMRKELSTAE